MDYEGRSMFAAADDVKSLETRVEVLELEVVDLENEIEVQGDNLERLNQSAIYPGASLTTSSLTPYDITPDMHPQMLIPFDTCGDGMALRVTVFGAINVSDPTDFRLYLAQDSLGNYPLTPINWIGAHDNSNAVFVFDVVFRTVHLPTDVWSSTRMDSAVIGNRIHYSSGWADPIVGGLNIHVIAQFRTAAATQVFTLVNCIMERTAIGNI